MEQINIKYCLTKQANYKIVGTVPQAYQDQVQVSSIHCIHQMILI